MQILIGCAKTMTDQVPPVLSGCTVPAFQGEADRLAMELACYSPEELQLLLKVNKRIANENWLRYQNFFDLTMRMPAVFGYDGMVYKKLSPETMDKATLAFANEHLLIGSFLYGLLRPLDLINRYRLEGNVELPCTGYNSLFAFWQSVLTNWFIDKVRVDDGILINLASNEFRSIFDWKRVEKELTVITPEFRVEKAGKLQTVVIYAKMCRGAMARWILQNRVSDTGDLRNFEFDGFRHESDWNFNLR